MQYVHHFPTAREQPAVTVEADSVFIGNILNWLLLGTLITQMYTYYQKFGKDKISIIITAYTVFCLDFAQTIMLTHHTWFYMNLLREPQNMDVVPWSASMLVFMVGLIAVIVQLFYAWRIWALARNQLMAAITIFIVLTTLVGNLSAIVSAIQLLVVPTLENVQRTYRGYFVWITGNLVTDMLITICMAYILYNAKVGTSRANARSETILSRMVRITLQTGLGTVVTACLHLFLFVGFPARDYLMVPVYILSKLYSNSLLLILNLRKSSFDDAFPTQPEVSLPTGCTQSTETHA